MAKSAKRKSFLLRINEDVLKEVRDWSTQDMRSLNAHIEFLLKEALKRRKGAKKAKKAKKTDGRMAG
ncbi:MAG: Arc family DNA-binding protein [Planctomycetes bacterium]|nr:Arc family DNA-binding protein [Planctomycetota bacterium]